MPFQRRNSSNYMSYLEQQSLELLHVWEYIQYLEKWIWKGIEFYRILFCIYKKKQNYNRAIF